MAVQAAAGVWRSDTTRSRRHRSRRARGRSARTEAGARRLLVVITSWRIVKAKHAVGAFNGEGARVAGGRWNSPGVAMVYTSESAALAALELLVHLGRSRSLADYVIFSCDFQDGIVEIPDPPGLPRY